MAGDWNHYRVRDLFELRPGFAFKSSDFRDFGVPVIKIKNVKANSVVLDNLSYVDPIFLEHKKNYIVKKGDILITMSGNRFDGGRDTWVGKVAQNLSEETYLLNQRVAILQPKLGSPIDQRCCTYILCSDEYQNHFIAIATSSGGQANLSPYQILNADIFLPPYSEQKAIAHILGTLDDKIELNQRMNQTLEAMARAIFQSWFVDFDPVRAKAEGKDTGLPKHIADLFPDSFVDSELGDIPRGWMIMQLGELIELAYGKALKESDRLPGNIPVYGSNGQIGWHSQKLITGPGIIVGRKGNPGIVTWVPTDFCAIDTTFYVVPIGECSSLYYLFHSLSTHDLASLGADSAVPGLNRNIAYMNKQVVPSSNILKRFDEQVSPLFDKIHQNNKVSQTVATLRDTLLPKLISGELLIKDAERFIEKVAP